MAFKLPLILLVACIALSSYSFASAEPDLSLPHSVSSRQIKDNREVDFPRIPAPLLSAHQTPSISFSNSFVLVQDETNDLVIPIEIFYQLNWVVQVNNQNCNYLIALEPTTGILRAFKLPLNWLGYKEVRFVPSRYSLNSSCLLQFDADELLDLQSGTVVWGHQTGAGLDYLPATICQDLKLQNLINPSFVYVTVKDVPQIGRFNQRLKKNLEQYEPSKTELIVNYKSQSHHFEYTKIKGSGLINKRLSGSQVMLCYFPAVDLTVAFENQVRFKNNTVQIFDFQLTENGLQDSNSSSLWDRHGKCINGRRNMEGLKLFRIDSYLKFSFQK